MSKTRDTGFINNILKYDNDGNVSVVSGSTTLLFISSSGAITTTGIISGSNALSASYAVSASNSLSAATASYVENAQTASYVLNGVSASYAASASNSISGAYAVNASNAISSSYAVDATNAANSTLFNNTASSVFATTGSNTLTGVQYVSNTNNAVGFSNTTASIYTDGGLQVTKDAYYSSSMFIKGNLTVFGTQSVSFITSSQLNISTNVITVNTNTPSIRFGGLSVYDSGSTGATGSIFWDSQNNHWIYTNPSGSSYSGGMLISGPRNTGSIGDEQGTTLNAIMKGMGGDHITSSGIFESGSNVGIGTSSPATKFDLAGTIGNFQIASSGAEIFLTRNENNDILATGGTSSGITIGAQSYLKFKVGTSYTERMVINSTGNVGIGTTNPSNKLTIRGTDSTSMLYLGISGASSNGEAVGITFGSATYDKARIVAYNENSGNAAGYLTLWTGGSPATTDVTERMRITSGGDVGIGTSSPAERLEVSGSLKIGNLKIQNVNGGSVGFNRNTANGAIYNSGYAAFQINGAYSGANYLDFQNYNSSGSYVGGFVLNNGNIGMGTTGPNTKLQILGSTLTVGDQSTYALGIGNSSGYDLTLGTGTSYAYIQSWTSKPLNINAQGNNVVFSNGATNVGIGTTNPFTVLDVRQPYAKTDTTRRDILYASNDSTPAGLRISITGGASQGVRSAHLQTTEWGVTNDGIMSLQPFGGKVGIGVTNPSKLFEVNGRMATSATVSTNLIAGNIATNMPSSPAYIPIMNLAEAAGMSLVGYVNAASYTCFNISQIYIRKEYSGAGINAGITGLYKNACDFSIVNITYSGVTYVALRFTSNPEIDVMWTGYLLNYAFNGDGSAQVWTSGVTLNSTYASY